VAQGVAASTRSVIVSQKPIVDAVPDGGRRASVNGKKVGGFAFGSTAWNRATLELSQKSGQRKSPGASNCHPLIGRMLVDD
jgi:hypothetical protein